MLSNNVVSFMKKMVKTTEVGGQAAGPDSSANKLTRLKQTLTTGLQQAHESVAKFSPKVIQSGVGDMASRRPSGVEADLGQSGGSSSSAGSVKEIPDVITNPPPAQKSCPGPPNRLTTCRVCVRSLSGGNSDVSFRVCSQCNLKVCEDCASYSNLDNDIDQTFWRCSVCRRRGASAPSATPGATTTSGGASAAGGRPSAVPANLAQQRWSEEKPSSLSAISTTEEYGRKARSASAVALVPVPPGSAPTTRRRGTSAAVDSNLELKNIQQQASTSRGYGHSAEDVRLNVNGRASGNGGRKTSTCALPSASISASESSPEDGMDHRGGGSRRGSYRADGSSASANTSARSPSASSNRRSFQQNSKDQSLYLSADDSRWQQQRRRYSSESSDASDASATLRRSHDDDGTDDNSSAAVSPSTTRRRMSFRSSRSRHQNQQNQPLYDGDGSDGYEADEQSASAGNFDSSPLPAGGEAALGPSSSGLLSSEGPGRMSSSPRRSFSDVPLPHELLINNGERQRKVSTQMSDPPPINQQHRTPSPRPSISGGGGGASGHHRRSIERAGISIIIDDVDSSNCPAATALPNVGPPIGSNSGGNIFVVRLCRGSTSGSSFTSGFGLTLSGRHSSHIVIARIDPHGPAERAGLRCGDVILSWDGVQLSGRSLDEVQHELQHSGDSIEIEVQRGFYPPEVDHGEILDGGSNSVGPQRPNKLTSNLIAMESGGGGSSGRATPPSPTRRRLPQAPVAGPDPSLLVYRVQLKFRSSVDSRNGSSTLTIAVLGAELPAEAGSIEESFGWITLILTLPNGAGSRMFTTDRIETMYGQLRWNAVFTCPDLGVDEAARSHLNLALWQDSFQRGEIKMAEAKLDMERVALDGRSVWFALRPCGSDAYGNSPMPSPAVSRRPSKCNIPYQQPQPQQQQQLYGSRNNSIDRGSSVSPPNSNTRSPTPPGMTRSRSAELAAHLLLQPEAPGWSAGSGLSAPASLAPSRRGSNFNCDEDLLAMPQLSIPQSSAPGSRRGSAVLPALPVQQANELANLQLVQEKLANRRPSQHQLPQPPTERVINTSSLELGMGQILPHGMIMSRSEAVAHMASSPSGQIKLGLIITQGQLEVEVIAARNLPLIGESGNIQPDTFVKVSLCDKDRIFSKRKTKTMRQTCHPQFHQALLFEACNALGATLVVDVRLKDPSSGLGYGGRSSSMRRPHYQQQQQPTTLGLVHIALDRLPLTTLTIAWYRLIPAHLFDVHDQYHHYSDDSP